MKKHTITVIAGRIILLLTVLSLCCSTVAEKPYYQGISTSTSYRYDISGRTDRVQGYILHIPRTAGLNNPGLVLISNGTLRRNSDE